MHFEMFLNIDSQIVPPIKKFIQLFGDGNPSSPNNLSIYNPCMENNKKDLQQCERVTYLSMEWLPINDMFFLYLLMKIYVNMMIVAISPLW